MPLNPALHDEVLKSPIERSNPLNDPKKFVVQGYNTFDLTNDHAMTFRFGEYSPFDVFETIPDDRHLCRDNSLSLLNTVDASLISKVNEYHDYFYVPMRSCFPYNFEKMIANPTKGSDLPLWALPMFPIAALFSRLLHNPYEMVINGDPVTAGTLYDMPSGDYTESGRYVILYNNLLYLCYALSRGQLLDHLGFSLDALGTGVNDSSYTTYVYSNSFQRRIDAVFESLVSHPIEDFGQIVYEPRYPCIFGYDLSECYDPDEGVESVTIGQSKGLKVKYSPISLNDWSLSSFRSALYDCLEKGLFITFVFNSIEPDNFSGSWSLDEVPYDVTSAASFFKSYFGSAGVDPVYPDTTPEEYFSNKFINPMRLIAYQQAIAEYCSNDSVDNVFTADLWMQNMRSILFPSNSSVSREPTFLYNGVNYEYDLFTTGSINFSLLTDNNGAGVGLLVRMLPFISNLFFQRRSLRYGDYFSTGRPDFLSVGQLGIPVSEDGFVDPVDVTQQILDARYLQATNWLGSRFDAQMAGIYNANPSDKGTKPYFISHRKIELGRQEVNGTAGNNQGKRVTNLIGTSDTQGADIYIDDFGVVLGIASFDVLPLYPSGVDRNFRNYDRFSMFNSMMQNVGDQDIDLVELTGDIRYTRQTFAYSTRYAQYKFSTSRAHGAFVSGTGARQLPVAAMIYPAGQFIDDGKVSLHINPDFIRDKPMYFDQFYASRAVLSPCGYFHFAFHVVNQHAAARRMQLIPQLLL